MDHHTQNKVGINSTWSKLKTALIWNTSRVNSLTIYQHTHPDTTINDFNNSLNNLQIFKIPQISSCPLSILNEINGEILKRLTSITLEGDDNSTNASTLFYIAQNCTQLHTCIIHGKEMKYVLNDAWILLLTNNKHLTHTWLCGVTHDMVPLQSVTLRFMYIENKSLTLFQTIVENNPQLNRLTLEYDGTRRTLLYISNKAKHLNHPWYPGQNELQIANLLFSSPNDLNAIAFIRNIPHLVLSFQYSRNYFSSTTDNAHCMKLLLHNNNNLEELVILEHATPAILSATVLQHTLTTCKNLTKIMLNSGNQFTDDEMLTVFTKTPHILNKIRIIWNRSITKVTAEAILLANLHMPNIYIMNQMQGVLVKRVNGQLLVSC